LINSRTPDLTIAPEQFSYRFGVGDGGTMGAYLAAFRNAFAVVGVVVFDRKAMADVAETTVEDAMSAGVEAAGGKAS